MEALTIIYYTGNAVDNKMTQHARELLLKTGYPIISVSQKPMDFGKNICVGEIGLSNRNIYKQILIGCRAAETEYVAMAEDDTFYPPEHFAYRPKGFAYNLSKWSLYTWLPLFSYKRRKSTACLIAPRQLLVNALEERFTKNPDSKPGRDMDWSEIGRYEDFLKVKIQPTEEFYSSTPVLIWTHPASMGYKFQGQSKKIGIMPALEVPYWGRAEDLIKRYV